MKWGWTKPRWRLFLCAIGWHNWHYYCASKYAERDSRRECFQCGSVEDFIEGKWCDV